MSAAILDGVRVLDFTTAGAGPRATDQLGRMGAEVLKIEPLAGNNTLRQKPRQGGVSTHYTTMMFNKKSAYFDPKDATPEKRRELIAWADVLIQNLKPGWLDRHGFSYDACRAVNPGLVYVSISTWGDRGPFAGLAGGDPNGAGYAGWPSHTGPSGGQPEFARMSYVDHVTGSSAATAAILGLIRREETGQGCSLHASLVNAALWVESHHLAVAALDEVPRPAGSRGVFFAPDWAVRSGDAQHIAITVRTEREWQGLCAALSAAELAADSRFADNRRRVENQLELEQLIAAIVRERAAYWWLLQFTRHGVPHALARVYPALKENPQIVANDYVKSREVPQRGTFHMPEAPWRFSRSALRMDPPPMPGADSAMLDGLERPRPGPPARTATSPDAWLSRIVVGDATQGIAGPIGGSLYAALGARVLKFEPPDGDYARRAAPFDRASGESVLYLSVNTRKEQQTGKPDYGSLDVLLVDQDSSWLEADLTALRAKHPRLVTCRLTANGPQGPANGTNGGELTSQVQAEYQTGVGRPGDPFILRLGADMVSAYAGLSMFQGTVAALLERGRSGEGQHVEVSLLGAALYARMPIWSVLGEPDEWAGHLCESYTLPPHHGYRTKDGRIDIIIRMREEDYVDFLSALGILDQARADPRFDIESGGLATSGFGQHAEAFEEIWSKAFSRFTTAEMAALINKYGYSSTPLNDLGQALTAPQVVANDLIATVVSNGVAIPVVRPAFAGAGAIWGAETAQAAERRPDEAVIGAA